MAIGSYPRDDSNSAIEKLAFFTMRRMRLAAPERLA
jgi:hypothetical protein